MYNLAAYFKELGCKIILERIDKINIDKLDMSMVSGIIISPGPGKPEDAYVSINILKEYESKIPILGVCLGHQIMAYVHGGTVKKGIRPMHGKVTKISHSGKSLFLGLPSNFSVTRYHSLVTEEYSVSQKFNIDAKSQDGAIMAISHKELPLYGIQFHPEAVLTEHGHDILKNFLKICDDWWKKNA